MVTFGSYELFKECAANISRYRRLQEAGLGCGGGFMRPGGAGNHRSRVGGDGAAEHL
jgi:hypothetical protein